MYLVPELILKTRNKLPLSTDEIEFLIRSYCKDELPDYQMSAWLMAVYFQSLNETETHCLTNAMLHSGEVIKFTHGTCVDKHSTGGVGDKTSMILGPIVACAGLSVPMLAGRGLGHTGGTLDKLESIPGLSTSVSLSTFKTLVEKHGICFGGQTDEICPADRRMYALRDVTATVAARPLICASIMSKKLAEGIDALVLDVKFGSGAFMKTEGDATALAQALMAIGRRAGKKVSTFITSMDQPLGQMVGNTLEIEECLAILKNEPTAHTIFNDTRTLSLELAAEMIRLGTASRDPLGQATQILQSGQAHAKFNEICEAQGGRLEKLPKASQTFEVPSPESGWIKAFETEKVGYASLILGAGRRHVSDQIDPVSGVRCLKKIGDRIEKGEPLFRLYASDTKLFGDAQITLLKATTISLQKQKSLSLIHSRLLE